MKQSKKINKTVQMKRMADSQDWVFNYEGKDIIKKYARRHRISKEEAFVDLRSLGRYLSDSEIKEARLKTYNSNYYLDEFYDAYLYNYDNSRKNTMHQEDEKQDDLEVEDLPF
jgi:hypothetical protein